MPKQFSPPIKVFLHLSILLFISIFLGSSLIHASNEQELPEQSLENLRLKPVTTIKGRAGDLLRLWYAEGTAAGNVGDYYDNRDNGHSHLKMEDYPQLRKIKYSEEDRKQRKHYAVQRILLPHVVFGNSSTSARLFDGGSNVRTYYTNPGGMAFLYRQYTHNNLYIYPAHHDYWQRDGHGDVLPTNSPYLIASKGSSGTDRKYMDAIAQTLAAFQPDTKKKLVDSGFLMPTIQMILRYSAVGNLKDYLTPKAHRVAGLQVDNLKMIEMAHNLQINEIPPVVQLKVIEEDEPLNGEDFFSPGKSIKLADTPCVIARIFRGKSFWHRMVVSAEANIDLNKRDLSYHWKVLQGDPKEITIQQVNDSGSIMEIKIPFHERQPITKENNLESNRVDIGVFVKSGKYISAPAFITSFSLDNEARTYDEEGRILEIGYSMGKSVFEVTDWDDFFKLIAPGTTSTQSNILKNQFSQKEIDLINTIAEKYTKLDGSIAATKKELKNEKGTNVKELKKLLRQKEKAKNELVLEKQKKRKFSINELVLTNLNSLIEDPDFLNSYNPDIRELFKNASEENKSSFTLELNRMKSYGIIKSQEDLSIEITPIRIGSELLTERLTRFEYAKIRNLNATTLSNLFFPDIIESSFKVNFVDQRLITPKFWRDVYHYNNDGQPTGWTRYSDAGKTEFNKDGLIVLEKDSQERCTKGHTVEYIQAAPVRDKKGRQPWVNENPLKYLPGKEIWHYKYKDDSDWQGEVIRIEKL